MTGFQGKLREAVRDFGAAQALLYGLDHWLARRPGELRLFSYYLVAQPVLPERVVSKSLTIREASRHDPVLEHFPLDEAVLRYRFDQGAQCLAVWRRDKLLGCFWMKEGAYLEDEVRCRFIPIPTDTTVWDFDVYLLPEYRLGRGFVQLWQTVFAYLNERGKNWSLSRISAFNARSLASHQALGSQIIGRAIYIKGRRRQLMFASRWPFLHFSRNPDDIPTLAVRIPKKKDAANASHNAILRAS